MKKGLILIMACALILVGTFYYEVNQKQSEVYAGKEKNAISKEDAVKIVKDKLTYDGSFVPPNIEVDHEDNDFYIVHVYEIIKDDSSTTHTATYGWYRVNKYTGEVGTI